MAGTLLPSVVAQYSGRRGAARPAAGLPPGFPEPQRLITPDCIQPPSIENTP